MENVIHKVEEITGNGSWISSIHGNLTEALTHAKSRLRPCKIYRMVSSNVWHEISDK